MIYRSIVGTGVAARRPGSWEFTAAHVSSASVGSDVDPIIGIDHFQIRAPQFAPHPHAGFSAVTYLFEDGEGEFINRDSLGDRVVVRPGAVIWTVTGRGVLHEEYPAVRGELSHGLQIFVNLPAAEKLQAPHLMFVDGPDVPVRELAGVRVRVVAGAWGDVAAKLTAPGGVTLLDAKLEPGAALDAEFPVDQRVLAYVIKGEVAAGVDERRLGAMGAACFSEGDGAVRIRAVNAGAQVVFLGGRPLREPVVAHGPFVMNTERQIAEAFARFRAGGMGTLAPAAST